MNERIKELKNQALMFAQEKCNGQSRDANGVLRSDIMTEKFAELIVAECLDVVAMRIYLGPVEMCRQECKALASDIKEHFGVEE